MKMLLVAVVVITVSYAHPMHHINLEQWNLFKVLHGKNYINKFEEMIRRGIFMDNKRKIEAHNAKFEKGEVSYKMKMNHFGDLMSHEIKAVMNGFKMSQSTKRDGEIYFPSNDKLPNFVDWRQKGAVTPVKTQGYCGSCWAFSATGSLEGQIFLKTGKLVSLSEQNLIDCSKDYGNDGCKGGFSKRAFQYIIHNKGIDTEVSYPYEARVRINSNSRKLRWYLSFQEGQRWVTVKNYVNIPKGNEKALQSAVAKVGPISVAIHVTEHSFNFYSAGIYNETSCNNTLAHEVLVVGYGTESGQDYWLVKNSWGPGWGKDGYIKMMRNYNNQCGIASMASYPIVLS